jgi:hypothetical protein
VHVSVHVCTHARGVCMCDGAFMSVYRGGLKWMRGVDVVEHSNAGASLVCTV